MRIALLLTIPLAMAVEDNLPPQTGSHFYADFRSLGHSNFISDIWIGDNM